MARQKGQIRIEIMQLFLENPEKYSRHERSPARQESISRWSHEN